VRRFIFTATLLLSSFAAPYARADGFAAQVAPPRFEVKAKPGATLRQVLELTNRSNTPARFRVHTADFSLGADYNVQFQDALRPDSCRPWVAIERPLVALPAGGTIRYRFEVQVPKDAPAGECRFAIMIEADEPSVTKTGAVQLPIVGRIGVIVYLVVGEAAPQIEIFGPEVVTHNGARVPALRVHNAGNAHTRISGFLTGRDAAGKKYDFTPSDLPILPGEVREVLLTPATSDNPNPTLSFPVTVEGTLEWADQSAALNERFK
jgi:fimbrial chaperone protein